MTVQQAIDNNDNVQSYSCRNVKCAKYYKDVKNTIQDMEYFFTTVCSCNFCTWTRYTHHHCPLYTSSQDHH